MDADRRIQVSAEAVEALRHAHRNMRTMHLAMKCIELGARPRTVQLLTGLTLFKLEQLCQGKFSEPRRGRHPRSREWYHSANVLERVEASAIVSLYLRLNQLGLEPPQALVAAYQHYIRALRSPPRISLDRALDLVSQTEGRWLATERGFELYICPACQCQYLAAPMDKAPEHNNECPFCKLAEQYAKDPRVRKTYPFVNQLSAGRSPMPK